MESIVFPDAALLAMTRIRAALTARARDVPVHHQVPDVRPPLWVQVIRTGGERATLVSDAAQLTFDVWADRHDLAAELAQLLRADLFATAGMTVSGTPVYLVEELAGPSDNPDPLSGQQRVSWTCRIHVRGVAA